MTQEGNEAARARRLVHGQVCYLQLPAVDGARAAAFYEAVFGWPTEHPPDFVAPGLIGQWVPGRPPAPDAGPMIWLHVSDLDETLATVVTARRRDPRAPVSRRPGPHPRHHRRPRRQSRRPSQPRQRQRRHRQRQQSPGHERLSHGRNASG
jgi:hypothetical protein